MSGGSEDYGDGETAAEQQVNYLVEVLSKVHLDADALRHKIHDPIGCSRRPLRPPARAARFDFKLSSRPPRHLPRPIARSQPPIWPAENPGTPL